MITVELLNSSLEAEWEALLRSRTDSFIYHSVGYRNVLMSILNDAHPFYLCAKEDGALAGIMPAFIKNSKYGSIVNSLPFFGSHGQPIISSLANNANAVRIALLEALLDVIHERSIVAATIIGHPLDQGDANLKELWAPDLEEFRIGQITELHALAEASDPEAAMMQMCHSKTRNMIRKGLRSGFKTSWRTDAPILESLQLLHQKNMQSIGGRAKPQKVFDALSASLAPGTEWRVWVSEKAGTLAAAVLCLYYHRTVEYFTPAIAVEHRGDQPLSSLIFEAMVDAAKRQFLYWNWGGTWASQNGVYHFKSRWGTQETSYRYYIKILNDSLRDLSKEELAEAFPYFYVIPYSALREPGLAK